MSHSILIVDDSKLVTDIVKMRLELQGYHVRTAQNGTDALHKIETVAPDLVILNGRLPGLDGYEVCRRLRRNPVLKDLRVIMLTSADEEPRQVEPSVDAYLDKEIDLLDLPSQIRRLLGI